MRLVANWRAVLKHAASVKLLVLAALLSGIEAALGNVADQTALLLEMVRQLRADYARDQEAARESRAALHQRVDDVIDRLAKMETTSAIAGEIDAQVRTELNALKETVDNNAAGLAPTIEEWKRIRAVGLGLVGLLAIGGISVGAILVTAGEAGCGHRQGVAQNPVTAFDALSLRCLVSAKSILSRSTMPNCLAM